MRPNNDLESYSWHIENAKSDVSRYSSGFVGLTSLCNPMPWASGVQVVSWICRHWSDSPGLPVANGLSGYTVNLLAAVMLVRAYEGGGTSL